MSWLIDGVKSLKKNFVVGIALTILAVFFTLLFYSAFKTAISYERNYDANYDASTLKVHKTVGNLTKNEKSQIETNEFIENSSEEHNLLFEIEGLDLAHHAVMSDYLTLSSNNIVKGRVPGLTHEIMAPFDTGTSVVYQLGQTLEVWFPHLPEPMEMEIVGITDRFGFSFHYQSAILDEKPLTHANTILTKNAIYDELHQYLLEINLYDGANQLLATEKLTARNPFVDDDADFVYYYLAEDFDVTLLRYVDRYNPATENYEKVLIDKYVKATEQKIRFGQRTWDLYLGYEVDNTLLVRLSDLANKEAFIASLSSELVVFESLSRYIVSDYDSTRVFSLVLLLLMLLFAVILVLLLFHVFTRSYNTKRRIAYHKYQNVTRFEKKFYLVDLLEAFIIVLVSFGLNFAILYSPTVFDQTTKEVIRILPGYFYFIAISITFLAVLTYKLFITRNFQQKLAYGKLNI